MGEVVLRQVLGAFLGRVSYLLQQEEHGQADDNEWGDGERTPVVRSWRENDGVFSWQDGMTGTATRARQSTSPIGWLVC